MRNKVAVPVDYFGVAGSALTKELLNMSSNNRARKVAFNNLVRLAKASGILPKTAEVDTVSLEVNTGGIQHLVFLDPRLPIQENPS